MGLDLDYKDGQTPLEDDEKEGLLIPTIATRGELDELLTLWRPIQIYAVVKDEKMVNVSFQEVG